MPPVHRQQVCIALAGDIEAVPCGAAQAARLTGQPAAAQGAGQAIAALVSLGYSQSEAALAVSKIDGTLPVEEIIKLALRSMAGRR